MNLSNLVNEYKFNYYGNIYCPFCKVSLNELYNSYECYCNCRTNQSLYYNNTYYTITSVEPWVLVRNNDADYIELHGGPNIVYSSSLYYEKEPRFRVPNKWDRSKGRDDMRLSRAKTYGGLKGSSLRARGTRRK